MMRRATRNHQTLIIGLLVSLGVLLCAQLAAGQEGLSERVEWTFPEETPGPELGLKPEGAGERPAERPEFAGPTDGEPVTLDEATRMAVAQSLEIDIIRLDQAIKQEELPEAESIYDTEVTVEGEYEIDKEQPASTIAGNRSVTGELTTTLEQLLPTGTEVTVTHTLRRESTNSTFASLPRLYRGSLEVGIVQPILENRFGLIDRAKLSRVKLDVTKFNYETRDRIEAHVFEVRDAYWQSVFAFRDLSAKQENLTMAQGFLGATKDKLDLGLVEKKDVYAAEANLRLRIVDALEAEMVAESRREELQVLLDLPSDFDLIPSTPPNLREVEVSVAESLDRARANRRDIKQLKLEIARSDFGILMAESGLLPQLDLEASYRSSGLDRDPFNAQGEIVGLNHPTLFAGFTFSQPLENRSALAEHRRATFLREQTQVRLAQTERRMEKEIRDAVREMALATVRAKRTEEAAFFQHSKLVAESSAYQVGRSDSRTVIEFQEDWIDAETRAQLALVQHRQALDLLRRTEHTLLDEAGVVMP